MRSGHARAPRMIATPVITGVERKISMHSDRSVRKARWRRASSFKVSHTYWTSASIVPGHSESPEGLWRRSARGTPTISMRSRLIRQTSCEHGFKKLARRKRMTTIQVPGPSRYRRSVRVDRDPLEPGRVEGRAFRRVVAAARLGPFEARPALMPVPKDPCPRNTAVLRRTAHSTRPWAQSIAARAARVPARRQIDGVTDSRHPRCAAGTPG